MSDANHNQVVLVEDNDADVETVSRAVERLDFNVDLHIIRDGVSARDQLLTTGGTTPSGSVLRPDLIVLDLNLPGVDGREFLRDFNRIPKSQQAPLVVLTTSKKREDVFWAYEHGASAYVIKPGDIEAFIDRIQSLCRYWLRTTFQEDNP